LREAAGLMKQLPAGTVVQVNGYTDGAGNPAANMKVSQRRADAVSQFLVDAGVDPAMLSERLRQGRMKSRRHDDRRVEFRIARQ
jgi:OmpA-OmpF porin, OOP family